MTDKILLKLIELLEKDKAYFEKKAEFSKLKNREYFHAKYTGRIEQCKDAIKYINTFIIGGDNVKNSDNSSNTIPGEW